VAPVPVGTPPDVVKVVEYLLDGNSTTLDRLEFFDKELAFVPSFL
jgi:hypothetical protein